MKQTLVLRLVFWLGVFLLTVLFLRYQENQNREYEAEMMKAHLHNSKDDALASSKYKPRPFTAKSRNAIVAILTGDSYTLGLQVLGKSLLKANTKSDLVVAYVPEFVSIRTLCLLESSGWQVRAVQRLLPPKTTVFRIRDTFFWMFTKLRLWSWTEYQSILLVDSDTLALRNLDDVFESGIEMGAALDIWEWKIDYVINGGVLLLKPNMALYRTLLQEMHSKKHLYNLRMAEQGFLGYKFKYDSYKIPFVYNVNLALRAHNLEWDITWTDARLIHFTMTKPFFDNRTESGPYKDALHAWWTIFDELHSNPAEAGANCPV